MAPVLKLEMNSNWCRDDCRSINRVCLDNEELCMRADLNLPPTSPRSLTLSALTESTSLLARSLRSLSREEMVRSLSFLTRNRDKKSHET